MWYVELNGTILPTPYQYYQECFDECKRLEETMCAVMANPVYKD